MAAQQKYGLIRPILRFHFIACQYSYATGNRRAAPEPAAERCFQQPETNDHGLAG